MQDVAKPTQGSPWPEIVLGARETLELGQLEVHTTGQGSCCLRRCPVRRSRANCQQTEMRTQAHTCPSELTCICASACADEDAHASAHDHKAKRPCSTWSAINLAHQHCPLHHPRQSQTPAFALTAAIATLLGPWGRPSRPTRRAISKVGCWKLGPHAHHMTTHHRSPSCAANQVCSKSGRQTSNTKAIHSKKRASTLRNTRPRTSGPTCQPFAQVVPILSLFAFCLIRPVPSNSALWNARTRAPHMQTCPIYHFPNMKCTRNVPAKPGTSGLDAKSFFGSSAQRGQDVTYRKTGPPLCSTVSAHMPHG